MAERQIHGFIFEEKYIKDNNLIKNDNYTGKPDATCPNTGLAYSLKCTKLGGSPDMGDLFRAAECNFDFMLVVGYYENTSNKTNIIKIDEIFIDHKKLRKLLEFDYYNELKDWIKNRVKNDKSFDKDWKSECKAWKKVWNRKYPSLRFKRDSKTQRRMQLNLGNKFWNEQIIKNKILS